MLRAWLRAGLCVCLASLIGCGGESRDSIITNTNTLIADAASAATGIKDKVEEYVKKKETDGKDEEGAKTILDDAVGNAKRLKDIAVKMQSYLAQATSKTPLTAEEKKAFLDAHAKRINNAYAEVKTAHHAMKAALTEANKKFEEPLRPLMQAINDAEGEFAAIARRK